MAELTEKQADRLAVTSEMNLRSAYFEADIEFSASGIESEVFRRTPVLDFMFCLLLAAHQVKAGEEGTISFTENDMTIQIAPVGEADPSEDQHLAITRSWDPRAGECGRSEFVQGVAHFAESGPADILARYPSFAENPTRAKLEQLRATL
ncbi:hypothetical protein [Streptomyces curacoi]|uniref:Uncharacterized protein n=1 Tax=Streptomyces curacoi TaxID=146536 RepID=A0A117P7X7_9ACTN|nr:hypothetical protein [Streptomyces curacoi]KUM74741.1 hypothetical protein AQI70_18070 [Streptomyces curacoi]